MNMLELDAKKIGPEVLITGGAGYLGKHLARRLLDLGCNVRTFDRTAEGPDPRVAHFVGDIRDYASLREAARGVDAIFHAAAVIAMVGVARPETRRRVFDVNVLGTEHVIRACRELGVGRLIYTSSANVLLDRIVVEADEDEPYAETFVDLYTETKVIAEKLVRAANGEGLATVSLRPGGLWGFDEESFMMKAFVEQLATGRFKALIGSGEAVVDNTHVENLVDAELLAAQALVERPHRIGGRAYHVTDDERLNGLEFFRPLVEGWGEPFPRLRVPGQLMLAVAHALEWVHFVRGGAEPPLTRGGVLKLIRTSSLRVDRAREDLGYEPRYSHHDLARVAPALRASHS
jgi:3beta-hydroxy-Delta5-steroid dehydrogenase / steroid Delta-isomerase